MKSQLLRDKRFRRFQTRYNHILVPVDEFFNYRELGFKAVSHSSIYIGEVFYKVMYWEFEK